jgi:hypothetical protein
MNRCGATDAQRAACSRPIAPHQNVALATVKERAEEQWVDDNARIELVTGKWNDPRRGRRVCGTLIKVTNRRGTWLIPVTDWRKGSRQRDIRRSMAAHHTQPRTQQTQPICATNSVLGRGVAGRDQRRCG